MTFPDPDKPFFSLTLADGRTLVCLFGEEDLVGYDPFPEFEIIAGIDDQNPSRFGNLRRDDECLVLRLGDGDLAVPASAVAGCAHAADVSDDYVTTLAIEGQEPVGTRNLAGFYRSVHHSRRRREHRALLEFTA